MRLSFRDFQAGGHRRVVEAKVIREGTRTSVVLPTGEPLEVTDYVIHNYRIVSATPEELAALKRSMTTLVSPRLAASAMRNIPSEARVEAARVNGRKGGRPRKDRGNAVNEEGAKTEE